MNNSPDPFFGAVILAVDDSPDDTEHLAELLLQHQYEVHTANSGTEALQMLPTVRPDLILTDLGMPGMDGLELCRTIHRNPKWNSTPIIFITGFDDQVESGFKAGASDYICKPFRPAELLARVRAQLAQRSALAVLAGQERIERKARHQSEEERDQALLQAQLARREALSARDRVKQLSLEKSRFLTHVSQAMRTPLNAMMGFSELLEGDNLDRDQREYLSMLAGAAQELSELVEEMLDFTESVDGQAERSDEPFDPGVVFERVISASRTIAESRDIRLETRFDPALKDCYLGNADATFKACRELVSAALHQAPAHRTVRLNCRMLDTTNTTQRVRLTVDADGLSLPEDVLGNLQATGWTGRRTSDDNYANLGMRYALASSLADAIGAKIDIDIGPAGGTRLCLELESRYKETSTQDALSADSRY